MDLIPCAPRPTQHAESWAGAARTCRCRRRLSQAFVRRGGRAFAHRFHKPARWAKARDVKVLVVEDDADLGAAMQRALEGWGAQTTWVTTLAEGLTALVSHPHIVVLDVGLPDGSGVALAERAATLRPAPLMLAVSGQASAEEGFQLARYGVRAYLPKPLSFRDFTKTMETIVEQAPDLAPLLVAAVGRAPFQDVLALVRRSMAEQALALSSGNRTGAARLLGVTRQAVQQLIRDLDLNDDTTSRADGAKEPHRS